ncbi:hypothetical protein AB0D24_34795 [Streptomyces javensis]|uniref:hypothetical protein n=1 Tax=Streptomyces javensis TaxID=114698 RepID=UPI003403594B
MGVRSSFWWTYLGAGFGGAWMMLVGAVAAGLFPKLGLVDAVVRAGDQLFDGFGVVLWTAINLIDFYAVRHGRYSIREIFNPHGIYGRWNWRGLTAYGVGFVSMRPFAVIGDVEGPLARWVKGADVTMLAGLAISPLLYLVLRRSLDVDAERAVVTSADAGLDPDPVGHQTGAGHHA